MLPPISKPRLRWRIGRRIPLEILDDCDRFMEKYQASSSEDALVAAWRIVEPWALSLAEHAWWMARWRVGTVIEPEDLVSMAKQLLLQRLRKRWDTRRGFFLVYALVSFRIEFFKWNRREMGRKALEKQEDCAEVVHDTKGSSAHEARMELEMALGRLERKKPERARDARWFCEHLFVPLRELAQFKAGLRGFSRSSLHLRRRAAWKLLRRELNDEQMARRWSNVAGSNGG